MKVKIDDFLKALSEICNNNDHACRNCPMKINSQSIANCCAKDFMEYPEVRTQVKNVVLRYMKGEE